MREEEDEEEEEEEEDPDPDPGCMMVEDVSQMFLAYLAGHSHLPEQKQVQ